MPLKVNGAYTIKTVPTVNVDTNRANATARMKAIATEMINYFNIMNVTVQTYTEKLIANAVRVPAPAVAVNGGNTLLILLLVDALVIILAAIAAVIVTKAKADKVAASSNNL
jgi:hypothetical protein